MSDWNDVDPGFVKLFTALGAGDYPTALWALLCCVVSVWGGVRTGRFSALKTWALTLAALGLVAAAWRWAFPKESDLMATLRSELAGDADFDYDHDKPGKLGVLATNNMSVVFALANDADRDWSLSAAQVNDIDLLSTLSGPERRKFERLAFARMEPFAADYWQAYDRRKQAERAARRDASLAALKGLPRGSNGAAGTGGGRVLTAQNLEEPANQAKDSTSSLAEIGKAVKA